MSKDFMEYAGYQGSVHYNNEDEVFYGKVMFIPALLSYEGTDVKSLRDSFREAVDDYLELCKEISKEPEKPFKGSFNVRTAPELHRRIALYAVEHDKNLNSVVTEALEHFLEERKPRSVLAACGGPQE
ncbi:MAG: type II toxin-antitoxin system HicB family antitoxin [Bryobacteraceae bacterium]